MNKVIEPFKVFFTHSTTCRYQTSFGKTYISERSPMTVNRRLVANLMIKPHSSKGNVAFSLFIEYQTIY